MNKNNNRDKLQGFHFPLKEIITFIVMIVVFVVLLVVSVIIPKEAISSNMEASAMFLCDRPVFEERVENVASSRIDRYADSILLGITWQYDSKRPLESVMRSSYYYTAYQNENDNLRDAVTEDIPANQQYLRYWHGSGAIVRILLTVLSIKGIYVLNGIVIAILYLTLIIVLLRRRGLIPAVGMVIGLILVSVWYVPLSLEYSWMFILTPVFSLIALEIAWRKKESMCSIAFLCFGMITNYLDFLTTETLTLTIPLLLMLWAEKNDDDGYTGYGVTVRRCVLPWGIGYAGTWMSKWALAAIVLKENTLPYVTGHIAERIGKNDMAGMSTGSFLLGAVTRNIRCVFPLEYGIIGVMVGVALIIGYAYLAFVYRGKLKNRRRIVMYLAITCIPYVRFIVLHNHSYIHCFFTYRAQLAVFLAMVLILDELSVFEVLKRRWLHAKRSG